MTVVRSSAAGTSATPLSQDQPSLARRKRRGIARDGERNQRPGRSRPNGVRSAVEAVPSGNACPEQPRGEVIEIGRAFSESFPCPLSNSPRRARTSDRTETFPTAIAAIWRRRRGRLPQSGSNTCCVVSREVTTANTILPSDCSNEIETTDDERGPRRAHQKGDRRGLLR